jgi:protein O-mannosyl-transferase
MIGKKDEILSQWQKILLALVFVSILAIYIPSLKFAFYPNNDDGRLVLKNPSVIHFADNKGKVFTEFVYGLYHPLTTISFAIDYAVWGTNPFGFRLTNLVFHLINTLLVFLLLQKLFKKLYISLFSAAIFGLHPMHVESVVWISERKDVLYAFFFLLSVLFYLKARNRKDIVNHALAFLFFLCSLLSKASAVVLPLVLVLIDYYHQKPLFKSLLSKSHYLVLSIVFGIINVKAQNSIGLIQDVYTSYSVVQKVTLPVYAFTNYLVKFFVPVGLASKHLYPRLINDSIGWVYYLGWFWLIWSAYFVYRNRKNRLLIFGFLFFVVNIILVVKIIPTGNDLVSERYSYVPYIGLAICLGYLIQVQIEEGKKWLNAIFIVLIIMLTLLSVQNLKHWKNEKAIWSRIIEIEPDMPLAWLERGKYYLDEKDLIKADSDLSKSIQLDPSFAPGYIYRGLTRYYQRKENLALEDFNTAIRIDSIKPDGYYNRGNLYLKMNRFDEARNDLEKTISLDPKNIEAIYYLGLAEMKLMNYQAAINYFTRYISFNPYHPSAELELSVCYYQSGQFIEAGKRLKEIIIKQPRNGEALYYYANSLARQNQYSEAIEIYSRIIAINPDFGGAYLNRGNSYQFSGDNAKACNDWQKALELGVDQAKLMIHEHCK